MLFGSWVLKVLLCCSWQHCPDHTCSMGLRGPCETLLAAISCPVTWSYLTATAAGQRSTCAAVAGPAQTMGVRLSEEDLMRTAQGHGANIQEVLLRWPDRRAGTPREAVFVVSRQLPAQTSKGRIQPRPASTLLTKNGPAMSCGRRLSGRAQKGVTSLASRQLNHL